MMRQSGFGNMMGGSAFGSMLNPAKQFLARSDVLEMTILPNPGTSVSDWFLPAKAVEFRSEWHPADPQFHEGEAVTRRISLLALGARPEQLPDLSFNDPDGARIYLDDTRTDMVETEDGTVARREFYVSVVPTRGGQITLPDISVEWLNTQTDEMQTATLAEVSIEAKGTIPAAVASPLVDQPVSPPIQRESTPLIMLVTAGLGALGITGAVLFWRRRSTNPAQPAIPDHLSSLRAFERAGDHAGFYSALLSLRSAPGKTNVAAINNAISQLENYAYSENSTLAKPDLGQILRDLVRSTDKTRSVFRGLGRRSGLPSLYPS